MPEMTAAVGEAADADGSVEGSLSVTCPRPPAPGERVFELETRR